EEIKSLGMSLEDMLISCTYANTACTVNDFEWYYEFFYGNCYRFNSGRNSSGDQVPDKEVSRAGWIDGLKLELFIDNPSNIYNLAYSTGVQIFISNKSAYNSFFDGTKAFNFILNFIFRQNK